MPNQLQVKVRLATEADREFCTLTASWRPAALSMQVPGVLETLVAEARGERVGMLVLQYLWPGHGPPSTTPYVGFVMVNEPHRRQGVGRALLAFAAAHLGQQGYNLLMSSSSADEPEPQAWHRHMGFRDCGIVIEPSGQAFNRGVGEVFFAKELR